MSATELRRKAAEALEKVAKVVDAAETQNRELSAEEEATIADLRKEAESYNKRAKVREDVDADLAALRKPDKREGASIEFTTIEGGESQEDREYSFGNWLYHCDRSTAKNVPYEMVTESRNILDKVYRSQYRKWDDPARPREVRNLAMNSGTSGGYLLPQGFYDRLMQVGAPMAIVRPRATVIPMATESIEIPSLDQTTAQAAGTPPYFGGVVLTWSGESTSITSTEPGFRKTFLTINELTGYTPVGRTLIQRSAISLEPLIYTLFGKAVAYAEDYAFLRGNGNGKPTGVLDAATTARIKTAARGSASAITFANATDVWVRVLEESQQNGIWLASKYVESQVIKMTTTANSVFAPAGVYIANTSEINAGPSGGAAGVMLFNRPVIVTSKLPGADVDGDFGFFDFSKYVIADGGPPEIASSDDYLFRTNERAFRIVHRVGGISWMNNPVTLEDGSTTVSPFVSLGIQ